MYFKTDQMFKLNSYYSLAGNKGNKTVNYYFKSKMTCKPFQSQQEYESVNYGC